MTLKIALANANLARFHTLNAALNSFDNLVKPGAYTTVILQDGTFSVVTRREASMLIAGELAQPLDVE